MCGINGIASIREISNIVKRVEAMNLSIKHRGPDASNVYLINKKTCFGHRRLSIIDLDQRSNQPMVSNSGDTIIIFNGEIFNYLELKIKLKDKYEFKTTSDTEVIIAGYEIFGIEWLLKNINGMFAIAIFDNKKNEIYLIRDRFGIKPLYFSIIKEALVFSSEIKGILNSGLVEASFNENAIDEYLGNRFVREPFTFFENIIQVDSASYIKIGANLQVVKECYYSLPALNFSSNFNEKDIISETKEKVNETINRWLIADVKVGAYLSGGVDSSLTTAILCGNRNKSQIDTYTIGFEEEGFNEFIFAREIAKKYNTNHREFLLSKSDYVDFWYELIEYKDAPLAVPNEIPLALMSSYLRKDITVVISGEGADELFGGYGRIYRTAFDFINHKDQINKSFYEYFINNYEYTSRDIRDNFLRQKDKPYRAFFDSKNTLEFENHRNEENIFRFFHQNHIKGLLNRVDMTTMQTSVEARPPFLDHELIDFVYSSVPYDLKLKWNDELSKKNAALKFASEYSEVYDTPKYILKKISESYLPKNIIYRRKMGFPVPLTKWVPDLVPTAIDLLKNTTWLRSNVVNDLITEIKKSDSIRSGQLLWMFMNVEIFKNKYFSKKWKW